MAKWISRTAMNAVYVNRRDLLDDPLFWRALFSGPLESSIDDPFRSATSHFGFRCSDDNAKPFLRGLGQTIVSDELYPAHFVYVTLRNKWRVGVALHACPGDFSFTIDIVSPEQSRTELGVVGGNFMLPAFRWQEVIALSNASRRGRKSVASIVLLLLPGVHFVHTDSLSETSEIVLRSLQTTGFATKRLDELAERLLVYSRGDANWHFDRSYGWINDSQYSFRNPAAVVGRKRGVFHAVRRLLHDLKMG
jgi:hypothetical protein